MGDVGLGPAEGQAYTGTLHREFAFLADLYVLDEEINHLYYDLLVPLQAFPRMEEDSKLRLDLRTVLNDTINLLDLRQPYSREFYASLRGPDPGEGGALLRHGAEADGGVPQL